MVRIGLIGMGRWGRVHANTALALSARCRLTHLATSRPEHAALIPYPVTVLPDWRALVRADCEAVIIASPPDSHAEILEECLKRGKACLVEKPLCLDAQTAERLHQRVEALDVPVLVNHTQLFAPAYQQLKQTVIERGEPVRVLLSEGMGFGPFRTHTSALWDWGPHDVSLCLDLVGEFPRAVDALGGPRGPDDHPELISLRLDFPGGACAWIQVGRLAARKRRSLTVVTDSGCYAWDELAADRLTASSVAFQRRYRDRVSEPLTSTTIPTHDEPPTMVRMLEYFLNGLAGGDRRLFGTGLAVDVTRVLANCEELIARRARGPRAAPEALGQLPHS